MASTPGITRARAPAREGLESSAPFTILSMVALPNTRRTPLAEARVRMGVAEIVFQIASLRGQRWTVRPPRDADGVEAVFVPEDVKAALVAAIMSAADGDPKVKAHLSQRSW
jgi:hypothetical protein